MGRFGQNALGSLLRTVSGAFLVVCLPPLLIRRLGPEEYAVWALAVEVATYLALLDLGALSAAGHFAAPLAADDGEGRGRVMSSLVLLEVAFVAAGVVALALLVAAAPEIWSGLPADLVSEARWTLALIGASGLLSLIATALTGYFLAVDRVVIPASVTLVSRLLGMVVVASLALAGHGTVVLAWAWAAATVLGHGAVFLAFLRLGVPLRPSLASRRMVGAMVGFCGAYGIWTLATVLVIGLDTTIVARLDFAAVGPYAAAAGLVGIVTAVAGSVLAPLVPRAAQMDSEGRTAELDDLFMCLTRRVGGGVVAAAAIAALAAPTVLPWWLGAAGAGIAVPLVQVLAAATAVRLLTLPYPVVLFGTGEHRRVRWTPLIEGGVNVAASVAAGIFLGPVGVALGTLVGAFVGVGVHLGANLRRTRSLSVRAGEVIRRALLGPVSSGLPALIVVGGGAAVGVDVPPALAAVTALVTVGVAWLVVLTGPERSAIGRWVRGRSSRSGGLPATVGVGR